MPKEFRPLAEGLHPSIIMDHAKKFDKAINKLQLHVTGIDFGASNPITAGRARLPRRMFGIGFRSQANTAPAAWMGCQLLTLPRMLDVLEKDGTITGGFMPSLTNLLGAGSFDHDKNETRFLHLCTEPSTHPLGAMFLQAWHTLQIEVSGSPNIPPPQYGILSRHAFAAGTIDENTTYAHFQKEITTERETRALALLNVAIASLPAHDRRRIAFMNVDMFSNQFVNAIPYANEEISNLDLTTCYAMYFGTPLPILKPHVGVRIGKNTARGAPVTIDPYGDTLTNATLPGGGWTTAHDATKWLIADLLKSASINHTCEVYGLFAPYINQEAANADVNFTARKRHGLVPDFLVRWPHKEQLLELKTFHQSAQYFPHTDLRSDKRCTGADRRASKINKEYLDKARAVDKNYNNHTTVDPGPLHTRLLQFGRVQGLAIGPRGEASADFHTLIRKIGAIGAERGWRKTGARSVAEAKALITPRLFRAIGINAVRAAARLVRDRLGQSLLGDPERGQENLTNSHFNSRSHREEYFDTFCNTPNGFV